MNLVKQTALPNAEAPSNLLRDQVEQKGVGRLNLLFLPAWDGMLVSWPCVTGSPGLQTATVVFLVSIIVWASCYNKSHLSFTCTHPTGSVSQESQTTTDCSFSGFLISPSSQWGALETYRKQSDWKRGSIRPGFKAKLPFINWVAFNVNLIFSSFTCKMVYRFVVDNSSCLHNTIYYLFLNYPSLLFFGVSTC